MRNPTEQEGGFAPNWLPYFMVENIEDATCQHADAGGRKIMRQANFPNGRFAVIADLEGAAFAVCDGNRDAMVRRDGAEN